MSSRLSTPMRVTIRALMVFASGAGIAIGLAVRSPSAFLLIPIAIAWMWGCYAIFRRATGGDLRSPGQREVTVFVVFWLCLANALLLAFISGLMADGAAFPEP